MAFILGITESNVGVKINRIKKTIYLYNQKKMIAMEFEELQKIWGCPKQSTPLGNK